MTGSPERRPVGETRLRLLDATVRVGARSGWGGVTTRSVATEAEVNPGLVHYHFGSVEAMRRAAVDHVVGGDAEAVLRRLEPGADPVEAVVGLLDAATSAGVDDVRYVFLYEAWVAARRDEDLRLLLARSARRFRDDLVAWVDRATGDDPDRADPRAVAVLLAAALDGLYLHRLLDPEVSPRGMAGALGRLLGPRR